MKDLTNNSPAGDPPAHYQQQEDPCLDLPAMQLSPMAMPDEVLRSTAQRSTAQPRTRRGWSTPTVFLLLVLSLYRLPHASAANSFSTGASDFRRLQPSVCSCAPMEYTFELDLTLTCPKKPPINNPFVNLDSANPGMTEYFCEVRRGVENAPPVTDFVPVEINDIRVIELDVGFKPQKSLVLSGLQAVSGFKFQFESKLSEGLENIPGGLQVILTGQNEAGELITNIWATSYTLNNCDTEPIYTPRITNTDPSIGWSALVDEMPPLRELCPAVPATDEPSVNPTKAPTPKPTPTPTDTPTFSPTTDAPTKAPTPKLTPTPTDPPTFSPTTVAPNARPTDPPTRSPTFPPTQKSTPTDPPSTNAPTDAPLTPAPTSGVPSTPTPTPRSSLRPEHSMEPTPFSMSYSMSFNFDDLGMFNTDVLSDYFNLVDMDSLSSSEDKKAKSGKRSKEGKSSKSSKESAKNGKGSNSKSSKSKHGKASTSNKEQSSSKDGRQRQLRLRRTPLADKLFFVEP